MRVPAVVVAVVAAGCGAVPGAYATNDQLLGPWRAEPLSVDPAFVAAAERACRPPGRGDDVAMADRLVILDARGGGRLILAFEGPGSTSECQLEMQPGGQLEIRSMSASAGGTPVPPMGPNELVVDISRTGGGVGVTSTSVTGRSGANVTGVLIRLSDGVAVRASVGGGWFTAWWPREEHSVWIEAFDASGRKIGEAGESVP